MHKMSSDSDSNDDSTRAKTTFPGIQVKREPNSPLQTNDIAKSKSLFQQMLMKFNSKPPPTVVSSILKASTNTKHTTPRVKRESLELNDFNPPASSTQNIELDTPPSKKHKKKRSTEFYTDVRQPVHPTTLLDKSHIQTSPKKHKKNKSLDNSTEMLTPSNDSHIETISKKRKNKQTDYDREEEMKPVHGHSKKSHKKHKKKQVDQLYEEETRLDYQIQEKTENVIEQSTKHSKQTGAQMAMLNKFANDHNLTESNDVPVFSKNLKSDRFETFLIQIPKSVEAKQLVGCELSLHKKIRMKYEGVKYDCIPEPCGEPVTFFSDNKLSTVRPKATLVIRQHIKKNNLSNIASTMLSNGVEFPSNLRERHPLFGVDYLERISLEESVRNKLQASTKRHKKHKRREQEPEVSGVQDEEIYKLLDESTGSKKHKKKKKKRDQERSEDESRHNELINQLLVSRSEDLAIKHGKKRSITNKN